MFYPYWYSLWFHRKCQKNVLSRIFARVRGISLQNSWYKFCNLASFIRNLRQIKNVINIPSKWIKLMYKREIFRSCFLIRYHLTKVSSRINNCIIFVPHVLFITQWWWPASCTLYNTMVMTIFLTSVSIFHKYFVFPKRKQFCIFYRDTVKLHRAHTSRNLNLLAKNMKYINIT